MKILLGIINLIIGVLIIITSLVLNASLYAHLGTFGLDYILILLAGISLIWSGIEILRGKTWPYLYLLVIWALTILFAQWIQEIGVWPISLIGIYGSIVLFILNFIGYVLKLKAEPNPIQANSNYLRLVWMINIIFGVIFAILAVFLSLNGVEAIQLLILAALLNIGSFYLIYSLKTRSAYYFGLITLGLSFLGIVGFLALGMGWMG